MSGRAQVGGVQGAAAACAHAPPALQGSATLRCVHFGRPAAHPQLPLAVAHAARALLPLAPLPRRAGLPEWARRVVFDEADLLLSGAYGAQMRIIWDALRAGDRLHAARRVCAQVRARAPRAALR